MLSGKRKLPVLKGPIYRNKGFDNFVRKGAIWVRGTQGKLPTGRWNFLWALKQRAPLESLNGGGVSAVYLGWGILRVGWRRRL